MYKKICRNSDALARKAAGLKPSCSFIRPQHISTLMIRPLCEELYEAHREEILSTLTRTRTAGNLTQYMYLDYQLYKGRMIRERISSKHCSLAFTSPQKVASYILNPERNILCINDVKLSEDRYSQLREVIHNSFETIFPNKSKFEK